MPFEITADGLRTTYLYLVSLVCIGLTMIGAIMLTYIIMTKVVFGVDNLNGWYQDPEGECEYILDEQFYPQYIEPGYKQPEPPSAEELQARYDRCVTRATKRIEQENKSEFALQASVAVSFLIVALPLFFIHWSMINRRKKKTTSTKK